MVNISEKDQCGMPLDYILIDASAWGALMCYDIENMTEEIGVATIFDYLRGIIEYVSYNFSTMYTVITVLTTIIQSRKEEA